ncbi:hypothetical protein [Streptomonospora wellingtoniae]|uniref:DNA2/NAM7 helicase-like C-terminal domain-containing protein n=1 Tax=Streptomonospora wellingtoniae TaxID=3075544 RepID=A0ABU2KZA0_9ACTN|nr:hypothetical protein [Streptomonospora sp. DSM 45055]MDT0304639.1 hypothetical protein [Streptomonospora sp. DSM 45055]
MRVSPSAPATAESAGGARAAAGAPVPPGADAGAAAVPSASRAPAGGAAGEAEPPLLERLPALLAYYQRCLRREAVLGSECPLGADAPDGGSESAVVCLPAGPEPLFSGGEEAPHLPPSVGALVRSAAAGGRTLRYGYPLVLLHPGRGEAKVGLRAAPLLVADIEAVDDGGGLRARAVSGAEVNPVLLRALGIHSAAETAELRAWLRRGATGAGPVPGGSGRRGVRGGGGASAGRARLPRDLEQTVRALLVGFGIERADPILPSRLRDALPGPDASPGARNVAVVYTAGGTGAPVPARGPGPDADDATSLACLVSELGRPAGGDALPDGAAQTALGALLGGPGRPGAEPGVPPVSSGQLDEAGHRVVLAALRAPLTVAAAPPGTDGAGLADAVLRTAAAAGLTAVLGGREDRVLDRIADRAGQPPGHTVARAGGHEQRAAEMRVLERLRDRSVPGTGEDADISALQAQAAGDWMRVERLRRCLDATAAEGRTLARLAEERRSMTDFGWLPDRHFGPGRGGPAYWLGRAERASGGGFAGAKHRAAIRRELGVEPFPENLRRLCRVARIERDWRAALERRRGAPPPEEFAAALAEALERHRASAGALAEGVAAQRAARSRSAVRSRLESLNWYRKRGAAPAEAGSAAAAPGGGTGAGDAAEALPAACPGFAPLLGALPAWAVNTRATGSLPEEAGLFDLAVVVDADQLTVADLVPLLYRAKRALVIGDPARPARWSALQPGEDERLQREAGLSPVLLGRHALVYASDSAYAACASAVSAAGRPPLWLEENRGGRPEVAGVAARHCYGGGFSVSGVERARGGGAVRRPVPGLGGTAGRSRGEWDGAARSDADRSWDRAAEDGAAEGGAVAEHAAGNGAAERGAAVEWRNGFGECEPVPGGVCLNRAEAHRVVRTVQEADARLPRSTRLAAFSPVQPQRALLRRILDRRCLGRDVAVYGPADLVDDEDDAVDVLVVSAVCSGARLPESLLERMRSAETWSAALGRTAEQLVVVGDRAFWRRERGPLAELARSLEAGGEPAAGTAGFRRLSRVLRETGARVQPGPFLHGHRADLRIETPRGPQLVLVDAARTGAELRRLSARADVLAQLSGEPVLQVPEWRCLHEPEAVAGEIGAGTAAAAG